MAGRRYTPAEKETGLAAVIIMGGSPYKAFHEGMTKVPVTTLDAWMREDPERYQRLSEKLLPAITEHVVHRAEANAIKLGDRLDAVVEALNPGVIAQMSPKELANATKNLATAQALVLDKVQGPLRGRPQIVEHRHSAGDLLDKLASRIGHVIDSTAEPIEDAKELPA